MAATDTVLVLPTQLTLRQSPLQTASTDHVLMIEPRAIGEQGYHPHRTILTYSALRHFRDRLRDEGYDVTYRQADTLAAGVKTYTDANPDATLTVMRPQRHGLADELQQAAEGALEIVTNERFITTPAQFDAWMDDPPYRHETFYRAVRRDTGYLMTGNDPVGGEWNYDEENRETPPEGYEAPAPPTFEPDATTTAVIEMVEQEFATEWADPAPFWWPVTRQDALQALEAFIDQRLPDFGAYQDAMVTDDPTLNHALLSPLLHVGLLDPREVTEAAIEAYEADAAPLNSVEGFVRQIIGWREFVRHIYRSEMPGLRTANQLDATEPVPPAFWDGETDMACVEHTIDHVRANGYAHHIQRLMVLANLVTVAGINPGEFNEWFETAFIDGLEWACTPNVMGMGTYASDVMSTKPYAASANYINKMSDHCSGCPYYHTKTTGEGACPFNALYWDFLDRNEDQLRSNHRMGLVYGHLDRKSADERADIAKRADELRARLAAGDL